MEHLLTFDALSALITLSIMEIILGIDNIIFITIITDRLPKPKQPLARNLGITLALGTRLLLLFSIQWVMGLSHPLFHVFQQGFSGRDIILILGGLFLVAKATFEIHHKVEVSEAPNQENLKKQKASMGSVLLQIAVLDVVFSLDSVITAVGMANSISVMIIAMIIAMVFMLLAAGKISDFVTRHPSLKVLALSFLILIGVVLLVEGFGGHVGKGYIYFAMFFSLTVELINLKLQVRKNTA